MENIRMDLRLFDANTQVTTQQSLTEEMKTFYSDYLIDAAEPELVHDQFAQKHPIPAAARRSSSAALPRSARR